MELQSPLHQSSLTEAAASHRRSAREAEEGGPGKGKAAASLVKIQGFWSRQGSILKTRWCRGFGAAGKEGNRREKLDRYQVSLGMVQTRSWRDMQGGTRSQGTMDSGRNMLRGCSGFVSASQAPRKDLQ